MNFPSVISASPVRQRKRICLFFSGCPFEYTIWDELYSTDLCKSSRIKFSREALIFFNHYVAFPTKYCRTAPINFICASAYFPTPEHVATWTFLKAVSWNCVWKFAGLLIKICRNIPVFQNNYTDRHYYQHFLFFRWETNIAL
jgi:hypothetical protein